MPPERVSRRRFVFGGIATLVGVSLVGRSLANADVTEGIATVVKARLDYLSLDRTGLYRFAADFVERLPPIPPRTRQRLTWLAWTYPVYARVFRPSGLETEMVTSFLLGSDFFRRGTDETRVVRYIGFYDPYSMVCGNPFARLN